MENIIKEVQQAKEEYQKKAREAIGKVFKMFMEKNPEVKRITWTQYTPHFNDGDPCVFSVGDVNFVAIEPEDSDELSGYDWEEYSFVSPDATWDGTKASATLWANIEELEKFMNDNESIMQETFGDGVSVTILPDGTVLSDEYDHD